MPGSKGPKILLGVFAAFIGLTVLHLWLNIGFDKVLPNSADSSAASYRVGFLPVT